MNLSTWRSPSKIFHPETERNTDITPFGALQDDVNRLFEQFFQAWPGSAVMPRYTGELTFSPRVDVRDEDKQISVSCDLPGMTDKDVEVTVSPGSLTIRGERKDEFERKGSGYYVCERSFGRFERTIALPNGMDTDKANASFKNGCLQVYIPKTAEARKSVRKLELAHN